MGLSSIALNQRDQEQQASQSLLAKSLIGSVALHIALLSLSSFGVKPPELAPEKTPDPIEVVMVPPPRIKVVKPKPPSESIGGSVARGGKGGGALTPHQPIASKPVTVSEPRLKVPKPLSNHSVVAKSAPKPILPPVAKLPPPVPTPQLARVPMRLPPAKPIAVPPHSDNPSPKTPTTPSARQRVALPLSSSPTLASTGNSSLASGMSSGNEIGNGSNAGSGMNTGSGNPSNGSGNGISSGSGRIGCHRCADPVYPSSAQREGVEGTVQVVFDADPQGNVSNVKVVSSSGHSILDHAALDTVKNWQLTSSPSFRRGILQSFTFAQTGSEVEHLARQRRERQQRQAHELEQTIR